MKKFNITGTCIPEKHFMVDTSEKIDKILTMIVDGDYFVINRPRQYGKTTTLATLRRELLKTDDYLPTRLSFEGVGDAPFRSIEAFGPKFLSYLGDDRNIKNHGYSYLFYDKIDNVSNFDELSKALTDILSKIDKKVVLMIDEVDKSSDNDIFIYFLAMLREKFLAAQENYDVTFHSVILAGLHDIKNLKLKIRPDSEKKYNSPWNIAVDFEIDMSFNSKEIGTMLTEYSQFKGFKIDIEKISEKIHFWTSGYPFLVSKFCKIIDEKILPKKANTDWTIDVVEEAANITLSDSSTLFDDMTKNLENDKDLFDFIKSVVLGEKEYTYSKEIPVLNFAYLYGIIDTTPAKKVKIHNKIYEEKITDYMIGKMETDSSTPINNTQEPYIKNDGRLDFDKVLYQFQEVIKEKFHNNLLLKSDEFLEKDLRLLFLVFLKPITNGIGFSFKEVETGAEKRLDIVVIFRNEKFVVELKIWRGPEYHKKGIERLKNYMKTESIDKAYMLIMNKNREKEFTSEIEEDVLCVYI
ncbi:MAG: AAA-like domain-containing protein [Candidatus Cloacimonetes bacterium]|nr:AAA-like domain-containing protein [Candidatus Cloacimonadota bacterium]